MSQLTSSIAEKAQIIFKQEPDRVEKPAAGAPDLLKVPFTVEGRKIYICYDLKRVVRGFAVYSKTKVVFT